MRGVRLFIVVAALTLGLQVVVSAQSQRQWQRDILKYTNQYRDRQGLPRVELDQTACRLALQHSRDMAARRSGFGHGGFLKRTDRLKSVYGRGIATGENVAYGKVSARQVVDLWIQSARHRRNLKGRFNKVGIGVAYDRQGVAFVTQLFVRTH